MKCISCSLEITTKMKAAIRNNVCPFCGSDIMESKRAKQYVALSSVLGNTKFTNKDEVDSKIREKVLEVLLENFEFAKLASAPKEDDLVAVDDDFEQHAEEDESDDVAEEDFPAPEEAAPARSLSRAKAQAPARQPTVPKGGSSIYHQAQRDLYEEAPDDDSGLDEDMNDPDLQKYFQDTTPAEIREKVEARLQAARNVTSSGGIRRLR